MGLCFVFYPAINQSKERRQEAAAWLPGRVADQSMEGRRNMIWGSFAIFTLCSIIFPMSL
jgi:hypothetical protein